MSDYLIVDSHNGFQFNWTVVIKPDKYPYAPRVTCNHCLGRGYTEDYNYDRTDCWRCNGTGQVADPAWVWNPTPPKELVDRLRKVYIEYWNEVQNENFTLT